jgi:hypothetical protein
VRANGSPKLEDDTGRGHPAAAASATGKSATPGGRPRRLSAPLFAAGRRTGWDRATDGDTVFLLSSGRSGSTWLGDLLRTLPAVRVIFEPFHPRHGVAALRDARYRYLAADEPRPALQAALRRLVDGHDRTDWTEQFNPPWRWIYRRRLLKAVRANLMSPWLHAHFPACRYLLLVRHPAAVVASQLKGGWRLSSRRLRDQPGIADVLDLRGLDQFGWPEDGFLSNLLFWAIENAIALDAARRSGALVLFYEDLCLQPGREIQRLADYLGVAFGASVNRQLGRSSWSSDRRIGTLPADEKVSRWTRTTSDVQIELIVDVLAACGLAGLYGHDPRPDPSALSQGD